MIRLAQTRRFRARWTEHIQREWLTALQRHRPELDDAKLQRTMTLINQAVPDCLVTTNLKDFPKAVLADFEIVPRHPDAFILDLADLDPAIVTTAAKLQRAALRNPPLSAETFVDTLQRQGLPGVASFLRSRIELI